MIKVCVLGAGKVGHHFITECWSNPAIELVQIYNRNLETIQIYTAKTAITDQLQNLNKAAIYIVCLPDDAISTLDLTHLEGLVVHTSGTKSYRELQALKRGVLYPLQSFSKEKNIDFKKVPLCLETEDNNDLEILSQFAHTVSNQVQEIKETQREKLHLAAVFANNFSNRMLGIAYDICEEHQIDFDFLQPLLQETFEKAQTLAPHKAQTGPAVRNDAETLNKHLSQLSGIEKDIYQLITQSIQEKHGNKL